MTEKRKLTQQIKSLDDMFEAIDKFSELMAPAAIRGVVNKGRNILTEMKEDNEYRRKGE